MLQAATHLDTLISERAIRSVFSLDNDAIVFPIWYHHNYKNFEHYFATSTSRFFKAVPGRRPVELFGRIQSTGYIQLHLGIDGESVCELAHRLLYRLFVGEIPDGWYVVHSDGCRTNNAIENLEAIDPEQCRRISRPSADPISAAELAQAVVMAEMGFRVADIARVLDRTHRQVANALRRHLADTSAVREMATS